MGMDVSFRVYQDIICPDCGKKIDEKPVHDIYGEMLCEDSGGRIWHEYKDKIGYTDADYGKYIPLDAEKISILRKFLRRYNPMNADAIFLMLDRVPENAVVDFEADW